MKSMIIDPLQKFGETEWLAAGSPRAIATPSTGTNHIDLPFFDKQGVEVFSLLDDRYGLNEIRASSEFTFMAILMALRRADRMMRLSFRQMPGRELYQKRVGIVGLGRIGGNVARWCQAFGCNVVYHDPYVGYGIGGVPHLSLSALFSSCDVVCITCSLTEETAHMIDMDLLMLLKRGAVLVNTARGAILNEQDTLQFLKNRTDITLFSDVHEGELEDGRSPFWGLPNAIVTCHEAGNAKEANRKARKIAEGLLA